MPLRPPIRSTSFSVSRPARTTITISLTSPKTQRRVAYVIVRGRNLISAVMPRKPSTQVSRDERRPVDGCEVRSMVTSRRLAIRQCVTRQYTKQRSGSESVRERENGRIGERGIGKERISGREREGVAPILPLPNSPSPPERPTVRRRRRCPRRGCGGPSPSRLLRRVSG